jgi:DNA polymerase III subunit epsilon
MNPWLRHERVAIVDFETTGMGPGTGARATEVGLVVLEGGHIAQSFSSLMHTGVAVPPFIERLTGISNAMLDSAPGAREVMAKAHALTQGCTMVAHNASFDRSFWVAEMQRAGFYEEATPFICTVKLARRLYPQAPNCKLGTLAAWHQLPQEGRAHRALADALTTAHLWLRMGQDLVRQLAPALAGAPLSLELLMALQGSPAARWPKLAGKARQALQMGLDGLEA